MCYIVYTGIGDKERDEEQNKEEDEEQDEEQNEKARTSTSNVLQRLSVREKTRGFSSIGADVVIIDLFTGLQQWVVASSYFVPSSYFAVLLEAWGVFIKVFLTLRTLETGLTSTCRHGLLKLPNSAHPLSEHFF